MNKLPSSIPLFPLGGAVLFPSGNLPLNIFEPRYIAMVDYALKNDKLIGMVQTKEKNSNELYRIGCIGKITSFSKTNDKRYLINLNGISRFTLLNELNNLNGFRMFNVKYEKFDYNSIKFNKKLFIKKVKFYFKNKQLTADWESLENIKDISLIIMICMVCPFSINEKQMLLESKNINSLVENAISLFEFTINANYSQSFIN